MVLNLIYCQVANFAENSAETLEKQKVSFIREILHLMVQFLNQN
jgi:hypothetical protein